MRLHQEMVLGVGGVRALRALGIKPGGLAPQRGPLARSCSRSAPASWSLRDATFDDALAQVRARAASSPSTRPVSAGNERFDADLVRRVAGPLLGIDRPEAAGLVDSSASWSSAGASTATAASST